MTPEEVFRADIREHPDDDTPRLVFADWPDDHGDPRGELVRLGCQIARMSFSDRRRADALARLCRCVQECAPGWRPPSEERQPAEDQLAALPWRLAEVIAWCAGRRDGLRSVSLHPRGLIGLWGMREHYFLTAERDWRRMACRVALARLAWLARDDRVPRQPAGDPAGGCLVALHTPPSRGGEVERASGGYFDRQCAPAWDAWLPCVTEGGRPPGWPPRPAGTRRLPGRS